MTTSTSKKKSKYKLFFDKKATAQEDLELALTKASGDNKHVLLIFGANWCPWCRALNRLLTKDKEIKDFVEKHYEMVLIDVGWKNINMDINEKYGNPIQYELPVFVVLDGKGNQLVTQETKGMENEDERPRKHKRPKVVGFLERWVPPQ